MQPPTKTRRAILLAKAEELNCVVPDDVTEFIAHNSRQNIRELEGALNKVVAYVDLTRRPIDLNWSTMVLADTLRRPERISVEQNHRNRLSLLYNVTGGHDQCSSRKALSLIRARWRCIWGAQRPMPLCHKSARNWGPRDHTTILHGPKEIRRWSIPTRSCAAIRWKSRPRSMSGRR